MTTTLFLTPDFDTAYASIRGALRAARQAQPLARVTLLLPGSLAVQSARKQLGDTAGVWLGSFNGLGWKIMDQAGLAVRWIADPAVRHLARHILGQMAVTGQLSTFAPVWEKPGFQAVLLGWLREMKSQAILPEAVQAHAGATGQAHDRQLADFYRLYQDFVRAHGCMDGDGLLGLAADVLEQSPHAAPAHQLLIAAGFDQFNPQQLRILHGMAPACADLHMYLAWDSRRPADSLALSRLSAARDRLTAVLRPQIQELAPAGQVSPLLERLRQAVFEPGRAPGSPPTPDAGAVTFAAAPSREAEVRWTLKTIKRLLLQGTAADQVALHAPNPLLYRRLVEVVAAEYGVPVLVDHSLADQPAAAVFLNLIRLSPDFPWRETLDTLRSPYIRQDWLSLQQIDLLERLSRERPVLAGRDQWRYAVQPIPRMAASGDRDEDFGPARLASQLPPQDLAALETGLMAFFDHLTPPLSATRRQYALWLQQAVLGIAPELEEEAAEPAPPPPSLNLAQCCQVGSYARRDLLTVRAILSMFGALVEAAGLTDPGEESAIPWADFQAELLAGLLSQTISPDPLQAGIRFTALEESRAQTSEHVFILGLSEGEFPILPAPDIFYSPVERDHHPLPLIRHRSGEQASLWWQVLSSARRSITLLRPRLDEKGAPWLPSAYWEAALAALQDGGRPAPGVTKLELPVSPRPTVDDAASPAELLLALAEQDALRVPAALMEEWNSSQAAYQLARRRQSWDPLPAFEGFIGEADLLAALAHRYGLEHVWSASRLGSYGRCPYSFFAATVLGLQPMGDPVEGFDPMQRGTLLHAVLERLFHRLAQDRTALTGDNLDLILARLEQCCRDVFGKAPGRFGFKPGLLWDYEQADLRRMLSALLQSECEAAAGCLPYYQELRFGIHGGDLPSLSLESEDGLFFRLHGVIDRVDRDPSGRLRVVDYKSGSTPYSQADLTRGLAFQSPLYALAVEQLLPESQVAESYYLHIPNRKPSGQLKFSGRAAEDETVRAAVERAAEFIRAVRDGKFPILPARPGSGQNACTRTCPFGGVCRVDRHTLAKARQMGGV